MLRSVGKLHPLKWSIQAEKALQYEKDAVFIIMIKQKY